MTLSFGEKCKKAYRLFRRNPVRAVRSNRTGVYQVTASLLMLALIFSLAGDFSARAATYTWTQDDWSGGGSASYPAHPSDQNDWDEYSVKDDEVEADSTLSLAVSSDSITHSTIADFNAGTLSSTATSTTGGGAVSILPSAAGNVWSTVASRADTATYVGGMTAGPDGYIYAHYTNGFSQPFFQRYASSTNSWTSLNSSPGTTYGSLTWGGANKIFIMRHGGTGQKGEYSISGNAWTANVSTPGSLGETSGSAYPKSGDFIYVSAGGSTAFYRYSITGNNFTTLTAKPAFSSSGSDLVSTNDNFLYLLRGGNTATFYRYSISGNSWSSMANVPANVGEGGSLVYPDSGDYIYATANGSNFYRYSISGDSWTQMANPPGSLSNGRGSDMAYPGSGNYVYVLVGGSNATYRYAINSTYASSGTFTSSVIDIGTGASLSGIDWTATMPADTGLKFRIRSATTSEALASATFYGPGSDSDYYTVGETSVNEIHAGHRYVQYRAYFETSDSSATPTLEDVTLSYTAYETAGTLTSSFYNANDSANVFAGIEWEGETPSGTSLRFQVRSAPDNAGAPGTTTDFMGPDGTASSYFTDATGAETPPSTLSDGEDDQWIQYKVFLSSDGSATPTLEQVSLTYVVNAPPEFEDDYPSSGRHGVGASQNSDGTVTINYSIRDPDTTTGSATSGFVTPTFEYSLNNGGDWSAISSEYLASGDGDNKAVEEGSFTRYSATWNAPAQVVGVYASQAKVRVTVNDNEAANNTESVVSASFPLDTDAPTLGASPLVVDASVTPASLDLSVTDDSTLQMRLGTSADLSAVAYISYAASAEMEVSDGDSIYAQFRDAFGNETSMVSAHPPTTPSNVFYQDISGVESEDWRLFFAWSVIDEPDAGFASYDVYRSVDSGAFALLSSITDRAENYYVDLSLASTSNYQYKVAARDDAGNISFFSPTVSDTPDGSGGQDLSPPILTQASVSDITTTQVTISWDTDKLSNSSVHFSATDTSPGSSPSDYESSVGVPSMVLDHTVTLSGLTPGTTYRFMVTSSDVSDNVGSSVHSTYTFTTESGPIISDVAISEVYDEQATIVWNTNVPATSIVSYSSNSDLSDPSEVVGSEALVTSHQVTLTGLSSGTKYYFFVKSADEEGNIALDKNIVGGVIEYYGFSTTHDSVAPVISDVATALVGETGVAISWTTDKPAISRAEWGTSTDLGTLTDQSDVYGRQHVAVLDSLSSEATYYYRVISSDRNNNTATSSIFSFTTLAPTVVTETIHTGGGTRDNRDLTSPSISNLQVDQVGARSATITFTTSKIASGVIEMGETATYGITVGDPETYRKSHRVILTGLSPLTEYRFRAKAVDVYGNVGFSSPSSLTTLETGVEATSSSPVIDPGSLSEEEAGIIQKVKNASEAFASKIIASLWENNNLSSVSEAGVLTLVSDLAERAGSSPAISGTEVNVETRATAATIRWTTDKPANSLVSYAPADQYQAGEESPYSITSGFPDNLETNHEVELSNLEPNTIYHFQVRSQSVVGPAALSTDGTFQTSSLSPDILDLRFDDIGESEAVVSWKTEVPTKALVTVTNTETGEAVTLEEPSYLREHTHTLESLDFSTPYTVSVEAIDESENSSRSSILPFTTVLSSEAPTISQVRITTSLIPDRIETAQTIISWKTDKPATSQVWFVEGAGEEMSQSTPPASSLVRDHIVVTTQLKPGTVYTVRVESNDSSGNITQSERYTVLTPRPTGSVVDLIFDNFAKTFGFLKGKP